mgnify:FL=1
MNELNLKILNLYYNKLSDDYRMAIESADKKKKIKIILVGKMQAEKLIKEYSLQAVESEFTTDYVSI